MTMTILGADADDRGQWLRLWAVTGKEPFAHPDYVALVSKGIGDPQCGWFTCSDGDIIFPFIRRELRSEEFPGEWTDGVSPYGYGGPFSTVNPIPEAFFVALLKQMHEIKMITLFGRISLETDVSEADGVEGCRAVALAQNVVVNLTRTSDDNWRHYEHKVRKNVNKARRFGLSATIRSGFADVEEFTSLYQSTMARRSAPSWYRFDRSFFVELEAALPDSLIIAEVRDISGRLISGEVVLRSPRNLYSFLGGTYSDSFPMAPNDLLKHTVIEYGQSKGLQSFVLGGGYIKDDGIFRYKRAFDRDGVRSFYGLQVIADRSICQFLTTTHTQTIHHGKEDSEGESYFPPYRAQ